MPIDLVRTCIHRSLVCAAAASCFLLTATAPGLVHDRQERGDQDESTEQAEAPKASEGFVDADGKAVTLERLFPSKSFYGPSASRHAFSPDGRHAAVLYRPNEERRHGNDVWLIDTDADPPEMTRLTSVSVLAPFQKATREVAIDRIEKAAKRRAKKAGDEPADERPLDETISGEWDGEITGGAEAGLPDPMPVDLVLKVGTDGSVRGTMRVAILAATVTGGSWNADSGELTVELTDPESGVAWTLTATLDDDAALAGTLAITGVEATLAFTATRSAKNADAETTSTVDGDEDGEQVPQDGEGDNDADDEDGADADATDDSEAAAADLARREQALKDADTVDDKDAEDTKSPRYGGVQEIEWSPDGSQLAFVSGGDIYLCTVADRAIERITNSNLPERSIRWLPDGSGLVIQRGDALAEIVFGRHHVRELDPRLPRGESISSLELSPDGTALVMSTATGSQWGSTGRKVTLVDYTDRFARAREVNRTVPDDSYPDVTWNVRVFELDGFDDESATLSTVFTKSYTGPRDVVSSPHFSPDSRKIVFGVFEQKDGIVRIMEASRDRRNEDPKASKDVPEGLFPSARASLEEAREVYRFLHDGGPNTPRMLEPWHLADSRRIVFLAELSGFRHLHVLDPVWQQLDQITRGRWEVHPLGMSKDRSRIFATTTSVHPSTDVPFVIDAESGRMTRLGAKDSTYSGVAFAEDGSRAIANVIDFGSPTELVAIRPVAIDGEPLADDEAEDVALTDSHGEEAHLLTEWAPEYFTYENRHGQTVHGHMFKPDDWSAADKRPLLVYVYGGPLGTRNSTGRGSFSSASYGFALYMAKKHGWVTCTIDPRGVSGYGGLFEKANFEQVGKPQVEDLVDGVKWFVEHQGVDEDRVALHGWSFGGFQTQMCLYTEPDVFAVGIAGAGPTEWENYNAWYTTGTIGPNTPGKRELTEYSLLPIAKNLKARLLLVHGMQDANVLYQDTVRVYRELLKAGKEALVDLFVDPTGGHGLGGDVKTINRYRKYDDYLRLHLGIGTAASGDGDAGHGAEHDGEHADDHGDDHRDDDHGDDGDDGRHGEDDGEHGDGDHDGDDGGDLRRAFDRAGTGVLLAGPVVMAAV